MKQLVYFTAILVALVVVGCGSKTDSNNAEAAEVAEVETVEAVEAAEAEIVPEETIHGGLELKAEIPKMTLVFKFYNDGTLSVNITVGNETRTYEGTWKREGGSYHDVYYTWYKLKYNFEGENAVAYIDENRRLFGPMYDGDYQTARAIAIADDSSDPLHNKIMRSVHNLTEVQ